MRNWKTCVFLLGVFLSTPAHAQQAVDYTTFMLNDPNTEVATTPTSFQSAGLVVSDNNVHAYKEFYPTADFSHYVEVLFDNFDAWPSDPVLIWGLSDTFGQTYDNWNNGVFLGLEVRSSGDAAVSLYTVVNGVLTYHSSTYGMSWGMDIYSFEAVRSGSQVNVQAYAGGSPWVQMSAVLPSPESYQYLYGLSSRSIAGFGSPTDTVDVTAKSMTVDGDAGPLLTDLVTGVDYNAAGQVTRIEYGNGTVTTFDYDPLTLRLSNKQTLNAAQETLQDLSYTYDAAGNIINITDGVNTATQSFEYDHLSRLVEAQGAQYGTKSYQYDEIGNLLEKDGVFYTYGENGAGPHAVTSLSSGVSFFYDANGNMIAKQIAGGDLYEYEYDVENRLIEVLKNSSPISDYEYDGDGGRTKKTVYGGTTDVTRYVGAIFEIFGAKETAHFHLGDMHVAALSDGELNFFHQDHLGGTNVITDAEGVKKELIEYLPYGAFSRHEKYGTGEDVIDHYFTGQRFDKESDLYYYNARYYDPSLGRFIQPDTIVPYPTNPQALNRYTYAGNNPVSYLEDGYGWFSKFLKKVVGAAIGAVVGIASGNPFLGFSAYNAFTAVSEGGNIGAALGGAFVGYFGGGLIGDAFGNFWGTLGAGALGGAAGAGIGGGDIGMAALSGLGGGWAGYGVGVITGFEGLGNIVGGGVGSEIAGGDFGEGALGGLAYNIGYSIGGYFSSDWETMDVDTVSTIESGDALFFENSGDLSGVYKALLAVFDPGAFSHTGIGVGNGEIADSEVALPDMASGPNVRSLKSVLYKNRRFKRVKMGKQLGVAARDHAMKHAQAGTRFDLLGKNGIFCSKFTKQVYTQTKQTGTYGLAPNTQFSFMKWGKK